MSATNTTPNYNLSQFIGTDKPAWLQDYNGDMLKIDSGINAAKSAADNAASAAGNAQTDATSALGQISTLSGTVSSISSTLGTAVGNINTINALIGNGTPTTTDQTIIGAINEINGKVAEFSSHLVPYDIESVLAEVSADGVKTYTQLLDEAFAALATYLAALPNNKYAKFDYLHIDSVGDFSASYGYVFINSSDISAEIFDFNKTFTNGVDFMVAHDVSLRASGSDIKYWSNDGVNSSFGTSGATVPTAGTRVIIRGMSYTLI